MKRAPANGVQVDGYTLGIRAEGHGREVMVLGSSVYYPRTFSSRLHARYRFAFVDLRHFARRERATDGSAGLDTYMDDIERLRTRVGYERFVLMGHSHHGNVALEYARRFPARVSRLVLIGTPPCNVAATLDEGRAYWDRCASPERKQILLGQLAAERAAPRSDAEAFVNRYVAEGPRYWFDPGFDASHLWRDVPVDPAALASFKRFFVDYSFPLSSVGAMPVLVVMGLHDYVVPPSLWSERLRRTGNLTYRLFQRSGHTPQLEQPDEFDGEFERWMQRD